MKLLLADDHSLFRDALIQYVERAEPDAHVTLARDIHEVVDILSGDPEFDLILLDFRMPGMNGLQGLQKLRESYPKLRVALMSGIAEEGDVKQAMALGAAGYFPKTMSGKALMKGIREILEGHVFIATNHNTNEIMPSYLDGRTSSETRSSTSNIQTQPENDDIKKLRLTPRETEVLAFLARGASNKEIARTLNLQIVTVKLHVRSVCRKLNVANRTQAALIAQKMGIGSVL